jgi:hypothetical protein
MTAGDVDYAQAAMTETNFTVDKNTDVVRTAMHDNVAHPRYEICSQ